MHPPVGARRWAHYWPAEYPEPVEFVDLGRGIRVESLPSEINELVMNACQPRGHYFFPARQFGPVYSYVLTHQLPEREEHPYRWDPDGVLHDALAMSRLIRDNAFSKQYAARITDYEDGAQRVMYLPDSEESVAFHMHREREYLDAPEAEELAGLLAAYWDIGDQMPNRVRRAIWRMAFVPRIRWADLALPIVVSGIEALLRVEDRGFTRQFKVRGAALASNLSIDDADEDFFQRMYKGRSDWMHGSHVALFGPPALGDAGSRTHSPDTVEQDALAEVARLQDVLRAAVRRCIEDADFRSVFSEDESIRERWPVAFSLGVERRAGVRCMAQVSACRVHRLACMSLTDDELLEFDHSRLVHFDLARVRELLAEQGDTFRAQLVAARWIEGWRQRVAADEMPTQNEDWQEGFDTALREVTAHLRQGDLIPGGVLHEETDSGDL